MPAVRPLLLACLAARALDAQAPERPTGFPAVCGSQEVQVLLLGTYHFANPGRDVVALAVDDVLQPSRQAQLDELTARLAAWAPDRIAVEWPISFTDSARARYARYRTNTLAATRNE
ncbi:MAG: hypothetical protein MUF00_01335 [Gemmatimonadaceae bacterium]|jgi:hypothetical protein|nr:hypothetical protein [Gemmatimonadaceae bacterium]